MSRVVGAYLCPRGVFAVECRRRSGGLAVLRSFSIHAAIASPLEAAGQLNRVLADAGINRAEVAVAIRGFEVVHHILAFPPAADSLLEPIIAREIQRLEPQLVDPVVAWTHLASGDEFGDDPSPQRHVFVAAVSREVVDTVASALSRAGHSLAHATALSVAFRQLAHEFDAAPGAAALMAQLPDGAFLSFSLDGDVRLIVEPPVRLEDPLPDAATLAEEVELGAMFVRQQFRGTELQRVTAVTADEDHVGVEQAIGAKLGVSVARLAIHDLSPGAVAAFGALLDARSAKPMALAGRASRLPDATPPALRFAAAAMVVITLIAAIWSVSEAFMARNAALALGDARRRIDAQSEGLEPIRETALRRRVLRDALAAMQLVSRERRDLQSNLVTLAASVPGAVRLDSIGLSRGAGRWRATIGGTVSGRTSGVTVQSLNDFYRDLPRRARIDSLALRKLVYADTVGASTVHFEVSFGLRERQD